MKAQNRLFVPRWLVFMGGGLLVAGHVVFLRHVLLPYVTLTREMLALVVVLIVIKHLGAFGPVYAFLRRRFFRR